MRRILYAKIEAQSLTFSLSCVPQRLDVLRSKDTGLRVERTPTPFGSYLPRSAIFLDATRVISVATALGWYLSLDAATTGNWYSTKYVLQQNRDIWMKYSSVGDRKCWKVLRDFSKSKRIVCQFTATYADFLTALGGFPLVVDLDLDLGVPSNDNSSRTRFSITTLAMWTRPSNVSRSTLKPSTTGCLPDLRTATKKFWSQHTKPYWALSDKQCSLGCHKQVP